jgi:hypothetical protein
MPQGWNTDAYWNGIDNGISPENAQQYGMGEAANNAVSNYMNQYGNGQVAGAEDPNADVATGGNYVSGNTNTGYAAGIDPTQQYIQSQMKGEDKQAKAQKKAWEELQKTIKNQYADLQQTGTDKLNSSKQNDLLQLTGMFSNANQDPNGQQGQQYTERMQNDYANQLALLLKDLASKKKSDLSSGQNSYQSAMQSIQDAQASARYKLAMLLYQAQKKNATANYNPWGGTGSTNDNSIFG